MAIEVESLRVTLTASIDDYRAKMREAVQITKDTTESIRAASRSLQHMMGKMDISGGAAKIKKSATDIRAEIDKLDQAIAKHDKYLEQLHQQQQVTGKYKGGDLSLIREEMERTSEAAGKLHDQRAKLAKKLGGGEGGKEQKSAMSGLAKHMTEVRNQAEAMKEPIDKAAAVTKEMQTSAKGIAAAFRESANQAGRMGGVSKAARQVSGGSTRHQAELSGAAMVEASRRREVGGLAAVERQINRTTNATRRKAAAMKAVKATGPIRAGQVMSRRTTPKINLATRALRLFNRQQKGVSKKAKHNQKFFIKMGRFIKTMIIFRSIFYFFQKMGESMTVMADKSVDVRNAMNGIKTATTNVGNALTTAVMPILKAISPILESISRKIVDIGNYIAEFLAAMFGQDTFMKATYASEEWGDKTEKAAKRARKALMGFDELNIITKPDSGADDQPLLAGGGILGETAVSDKMKNLADAIKQPFKTAFDWIQERMPGIAAGMQTMGQGIGNVFRKIGEDMYGIWDRNLREPSEKAFLLIKDTLLPDLKNSFETVFGPGILESVQLTYDGILEILDPLTGFLGEIADTFLDSFTESWPEILSIAEERFITLKEIYDNAVGEISQIIGEFFDELKEGWERNGKDIWDTVFTIYKSIEQEINRILNGTILPMVNKVLETMNYFWETHLKDVVGEVMDFLGHLFRAAEDIWNGFIKPIIDWIQKNLMPIVVWGFGFTVDFVEATFAQIAGIISGVISVLSGVIDIIAGILTGDWGRVWDGMVAVTEGAITLVENIVDGIARIIAVPLNVMIDLINSTIKGHLNKIKIPDWVPGIGGKGMNIPTIPRIPKFATGGVVEPRDPFLALLGDNSREREVVSPLSTLQDAMRSVLSDARQSGGVQGDLTIEFNLGGDKLIEHVIRGQNKAALQSGRMIVNI